ncbi:MAG TPA: B12-binding domain-containing radical SAM protein [Elusimicrobiota bacterium]|nr:B12-binding domain-containing radical SAM protein [Elusimicrobiota bacterium]
MRCLLLYPRFSRYSFWNYSSACELAGHKYPTSPLGLLTVAALLPAGWEPRLVDLNTRDLLDEDLDWADVVLTGGMITQQAETLRLMRRAKARGKLVAVGGPDATSQPEVYREADFLVLGEGELTVPRFTAALASGARRGVFRADEAKADLSRSPVPRYDLLRFSDYAYIGVQTSRGCPYQCEFCDIIELYGRVPRIKEPERVLAELETLYQAGFRGHVDFVDDNFIGNRKAAARLLRELIAWSEARGRPFYFSTEATITLAKDEELLGLMRAADFRHVFIGIETPDPALLRSTRKAQNALAPVAGAVRRIHEAGLMVLAGFIVGFDGEKPGAAQAIERLVEETGICVAMTGLLTSLPNTQLDRRLAAEGRLFARDGAMVLREEVDQTSAGLNFLTSRPRAEILAEYREALARMYSPAGYFGRMGRFLEALQPAWRHRPTKGMAARYGKAFARITWALARHPDAFWRYLRELFRAAARGRDHVAQAVALSALYVHFREQSRYVLERLDAEVRELRADGEEAFLKKRNIYVRPTEAVQSVVSTNGAQ